MLLRTRIPLIGVAVLAVTIVGTSLVAYELSRVQGRAAIDDVLRQELSDFELGFPEVVAELGRDDPQASELVAAAGRYLSLNPGSPQHLTLITIGQDRLANSNGPELLRELYVDDRLPAGRLGTITTADTDRGEVRVLSSPVLRADGTPVGSVTVIGPLSDVIDDARTALVRVALAGLLGLVVGGAVLAVATRHALVPLGQLATAARLTTGLEGTRAPQSGRSDEVGVLARELNEMLDRVEEHRRRRDQLLASVSHELRTPVAVAAGHLEVFEQVAGADPDAVRVATVVRAELARLTRIIDDVSAANRGEETAVVIGPVFLPDLFDSLRHRLDGLQVDQVTLETPPDAVLDLDEQRVLQSLLNLVNNALDHNEPGVAVSVTAHAAATHTDLNVRDNGQGMEPHVASVAFEPFMTTRATGPLRSTGLGLSVVRTLTLRQGGTVHVDTGPTGTCVTLRFPNPI